MINQDKEYSPEQISNAKKMCQLISKAPAGKQTFISAFMLAYMNGIETGLLYAQNTEGSEVSHGR